MLFCPYLLLKLLLDSLLILRLWIRLFCLLGNEAFYLSFHVSVDLIRFGFLPLTVCHFLTGRR